VTSDEARELFSAAYDGELDEAQRRELDAALAADDELAAEYRELEALLREAGAIGDEGDESAPDLLAGVQNRLRVRSRGRFYRDRFASEAKARSMLPIYLGVAMLLLIAIAWLTMHVVRVGDAPHSTAPQSEPIP
jgi:anti-sigma factor RsiW